MRKTMKNNSDLDRDGFSKKDRDLWSDEDIMASSSILPSNPDLEFIDSDELEVVKSSFNSIWENSSKNKGEDNV